MQATNSTTSSSKKRKAQNGVVNSQKSLNHDYLCPVCFEILDEAHVTKCGHTFCLKCIVESLAETNRCPQCNYIVDSYFPNFLVNEVITKYKKDKMIEKKFITNVNAKQKINELHRFFLDKYDELSLPEINQMVEILNSKKNRLEKDLKMQQNVLLKEFLDNAYMHKMQQFEQLQRELEHIKEDQQELLKIIDIDEDIKASESLENKSKETEKDNNIDNTDNDNHVREESSSFIVSQIAGTSWSGGYDDQQSNSGFPTLVNYDSPNSSKFIHSFNSIGFGECEHTEPQIKDLEHREESYLNVRRKKMNFHFKDLEKNYFDRCQKDTFTSIDSNTRLTDLKEILTKFTHFSNLRPLATLTYAKEYVIHNIVSSIEFDKDAEFFGIAGVSKKIKIFDYAAVVKDSLGINYPVNEIECTSKISCLNWNPYYKSMMATSDYEGSVIIWDAFLGKRITSFQEHEKRCWSVDFNKIDINLIASGSDDSKVKIWSANMDSSILTLDGPANICCVRFNPKSLYNIAFGSADHRVYYYDLRNTREPLMKYKEHRKAVSYVKFLNSTELVSASTDSQIKLWNTNDPSCLRTFKGHMNEKNFVGLTANENYIACGSENNSLYVYYKGIDRQMLAYCFERKTQTEESSDFVSAVCWRPGSNVLVAANSQGNIKILELI